MLDVYWVAFLSKKTNIDPRKIWEEKKIENFSWKHLESKYIGEDIFFPSVTDDIYTDTQEQFLGKSSKRFLAAATSQATDDLDSKYTSVLNGLIAMQSIHQTNKIQFAEYNKENELIDPASGSLTWKHNEMSFPGRDGLDLNLGIMYNSNESSPYERISNKKGYARTFKENYLLNRYDLGLGWSFQFPSVQVEENYMYYHNGEGAAYRLDYNSAGNGPTTEMNLYLYQGKDLRFVIDSGSFNNGEENSAYYLENANKKREYFSKDGRLIGIVDRFNNKIVFNYIDHEAYNDKVNQTPILPKMSKVISKITDSLNRTIEFKYDSNLRKSDFQGDNITVIAKDNTSKEIKRVVFTKSRISLDSENGYAPLLRSVQNSLNEEKLFEYDLKVGLFTFRGSHYPLDTMGAQEPFALLQQVKNPRLVTNYNYESSVHGLGSKGSVKDYRIKSRYDQVYRQADKEVEPVGDYNRVDYSYVGSYSNQRYPLTEQEYRYSSTSNSNRGGLIQTNTFNGFDKLISEDTLTNKGERTIVNNLEFNSTFRLKPTVTQTIQQDADGSTTRTSETIYNDWGGIQSQTDALTDSDFNNATTKAQHTINYAYEDTYKQLASKSWYQSADKQVSEKYNYTADGRPQSTTNTAGETTTYSYEASPLNAHQIQKVTISKPVRSGVTSTTTTAYGEATNYAYPTEQTQSITNTARDGSKNTQVIRQQTKYDMGTGLPTQQIDSNGKATTTTYDALGRPVKIVSPSITNLDGTVYAVEDQYGYTNRAYSTEADSTNAGILTMRVDAIRQYTNTTTGAVTVLSRQSSYYDGFGFLRVDETYNESNGWTRSQYHPDDQGRAIYAIDPLGNTQTASYDAWGQQVEATDPYGNLYITANHMTQRKNNHFAIAASDVSAYRTNTDNRSIRLNAVEQSYDFYGNLATTTAFKDGASQSQPIQESYTYDLQGNILSYTDPNQTKNSSGVTNNYTYDALNRLTAVQDGIDQTTRYAYDGTGGLTKITVNDSGGKSETLYTKAYNEAGQLTDKTDTSGKNTANSYSSRGLVEEMRDRNGTITNYQYDERGQRTVATLTATNGNTLQTKTIFGSGGNILTDRHELYLNGTKTATQTSTIDKQDRITSLTSTGTNQYSSRLDVAYDTLDRITNQKNSLSGSSFFTNYGYDKLRLSQIQTNGAQTRNTAKANNVNYEYTPLGMVQAITFPTLADGSVLKESFTYDALNRLSQMSNTKGSNTLSAYSYTYDNNGNILTVSESLNGGEAKTSTYTYDKLNRLATVKRIDGSTASYTYDLRGNRKTLSDTQEASATKESNYSYDLDNKLITATIDGTKTTIDYLPDGLRSQKATGTATTQYGYNGSGQVVSEKGSNGNSSTYIRGDRVLVKKDQTASKDYYYLFNGHGDVVQMVDTSGTIVNSYGYDEWGNIAKQQETVSNSFKYAGESYDSETGLYYLKSRYYDPSQGRFLNEDSYEGQITNPLSLNNYTYVENSPLIYIDPLGFAASYVFYTTNPDSNFKAQADFQKERLEKNGDTVNMMESNTIEKFEDGWNNIGVVDGKQVEVNEVVIISHTRENVIIFQDGTSTNAMSISGKNSSGQKIGNFSQLESKKMTSLTFLTCNAGHLATFSTGNDNLASYFLKNKVDGGIVYAYDGNVVFGSKWTRWATNDLTSRLSSEQDTHYSILKKYHQKARKPYGKVSYHIDENGKVLAGF
ncbi:RHS repeat-associated core domain-containing protein [Paenibacillus sp. PK4536]|uniref:RHS repeat domain-containing protein n=1 Tax=Paenibacillus sp. PK4536 TaxID=3024576 RepID=UPI0023597074|nr:RHS repeat-associated core domain-containing protein [Paenibacillus sp. PK4536]WIM40606.1 RHS repeat-associated core domain-containing protein [Paenibacillus sp. PK4536]